MVRGCAGDVVASLDRGCVRVRRLMSGWATGAVVVWRRCRWARARPGGWRRPAGGGLGRRRGRGRPGRLGLGRCCPSARWSFFVLAALSLACWSCFACSCLERGLGPWAASMSGCGTGVMSRAGTPAVRARAKRPEERRGQPVPARAEQVAVQWAGQPLGDQHRPAGERARAGLPGGLDAGQADRGPLRQVGLPAPDDLAPVAARGVHPDRLAGAAQLVAPADDDLRVGVGVGAPQGACGDVLDVEPPPARVQAGGLGAGQRVRGIGGTGRPQQARALTTAGPGPVGGGEVGGGGRAGHHVRVHHAAHRPGPGHLLLQARVDGPRPPGGDLDDGEVDVDVGKGMTALRPTDVGAPAGTHDRPGGQDALGARRGREPGVVRLVDRHGHGVNGGCGHRVGGQRRRRGGRLGRHGEPGQRQHADPRAHGSRAAAGPWPGVAGPLVAGDGVHGMGRSQVGAGVHRHSPG